MPNGHGGIPWMGSPVLALAGWAAVLRLFQKTRFGWLVPALVVLAVVFGWRLAHHLHLWNALEYGGTLTSPDEMARARKKFRIASFVYSVLAVAATLYFVRAFQ